MGDNEYVGNQCGQCAHREVCKYIERVQEATRELETIFIDPDKWIGSYVRSSIELGIRLEWKCGNYTFHAE